MRVLLGLCCCLCFNALLLWGCLSLSAIPSAVLLLTGASVLTAHAPAADPTRARACAVQYVGREGKLLRLMLLMQLFFSLRVVLRVAACGAACHSAQFRVRCCFCCSCSCYSRCWEFRYARGCLCSARCYERFRCYVRESCLQLKSERRGAAKRSSSTQGFCLRKRLNSTTSPRTSQRGAPSPATGHGGGC